MTDIDIKTLDIPQLKALVDQLEAETKDLHERYDNLRSHLGKARHRLTELTTPYWEGDVIEDELGVRYRVTGVNYEGRASGIRLNEKGVEAHKDPRRIYSKKIKKVDV